MQRPTTAIQKKAGCGRPIPWLSLDSARLTLRALCSLCPHRLPEPAFTLPAKRNKPCPTCHPRIVHLRHCTNAQTTPADHPGIRDGEGRVRYGRTVASRAHGPTWRGQRGAPPLACLPPHVMTCHCADACDCGRCCGAQVLRTPLAQERDGETELLSGALSHEYAHMHMMWRRAIVSTALMHRQARSGPTPSQRRAPHPPPKQQKNATRA